MSQSEDKRYDGCAEVEVIPGDNGNMRIYVKNPELSVESAKELVKQIQAASKDMESAKDAKASKANKPAESAKPADAGKTVPVKAVETDKKAAVAVKPAAAGKDIKLKADEEPVEGRPARSAASKVTASSKK